MINDSRFESATPRRFSEPQLEGFLERHGCSMLRIARRFSANHADAEDAYQRSLEVLLTKAPEDDESGLAAWLATVVRNEALMIVRKQKHMIGAPIEDVGERWPAETMAPDEQLVERELADHGREALLRLSADQARFAIARRRNELCRDRRDDRIFICQDASLPVGRPQAFSRSCSGNRYRRGMPARTANAVIGGRWRGL